jgi:phosphohistidine phosphatase SixA
VRLYLCRHAHSDPGEPDELRPLSRRGEEQAAALGARLAAEAEPPVLVLSSPLLRARQTARAVAAATGAELRTDGRLGPGARPELLLAALVGTVGPVAAVGHQPDCSEIAIELTGSDPGFAPADMASLEIADPE